MPDTDGKREWLDSADRETGSPGLPRPDLNPLVNPLLGKHMGRWAQVYFTSAPEERERAVEKLLQELQSEVGQSKSSAVPPVMAADPAQAAPAVKMSSTEPHEPSMPQFAKLKSPPLEPADQDFMVCPACFHKNAVEQRFCGICGFSLIQAAAPSSPQPPAPQSASASSTRLETLEPDWQWLRQKTFSAHAPLREPKTSSRFLLGVVVLLAIAGGGYLVWQNRNPSREQVPNSSAHNSQKAQVSAGYEVNVRAAAITPPQGIAVTNRTPSTVSSQPSRPASSTSAANPSEPATAQSADDGSNELEQAQRYLDGNGVPRNSWMASQFLWKAIGKKNSGAVLLLSDLYARGDGVPHSCEQARVLLIASAKNGSAAAADKLRTLENSCR